MEHALWKKWWAERPLCVSTEDLKSSFTRFGDLRNEIELIVTATDFFYYQLRSRSMAEDCGFCNVCRRCQIDKVYLSNLSLLFFMLAELAHKPIQHNLAELFGIKNVRNWIVFCFSPKTVAGWQSPGTLPLSKVAGDNGSRILESLCDDIRFVSGSRFKNLWAEYIFSLCSGPSDYWKPFCRMWNVAERREKIRSTLVLFLPANVCDFIVLPSCGCSHV